MGKLKQYALNLLVMLDQALNTVLGGDPDMTISGRAGRAVAEGRCVVCKGLCKVLGWLDKDHCVKQAKAEDDEVGAREVWRW